MEQNKILIVIPARGNSKGIPRKNVRSLNGKPLITYSIKNALNSKFKPDVVVSSDDQEILTLAAKTGAQTIARGIHLAEDNTTLDPVIYHAYRSAVKINRYDYQLIITAQPTSPLLKSDSLDQAIQQMLDHPEIDTMISACEDTHLTWKLHDGQFVPNYEKRVNRQYMEPVFKESGGFLITRPNIISENNRIGKNVQLYVLSGPEAADIDTFEDWSICEYHLRRKKILFVVTGNSEVGLGHVYRCLGIANEILNHEVQFLVDEASAMALEKIAENNYRVIQQKQVNIIDDINEVKPDIVVNDILDTQEDYIASLKSKEYKVVNFEDLGAGAALADLVINALYPEKGKFFSNHHYGPKYCCLKSEFYLSPKKVITEEIRSVLLTFGGVDPNNYTKLVLESIYPYCKEEGIKIVVIAGLGYKFFDSLAVFENVEIHRNINNMSDHMLKADIIFTSAGRTTYEVASIGVPTIILAQNERELSHFFGGQEYGFVNLGLGYKLTSEDILQVFDEVKQDFKKRLGMSQLMLNEDLLNGKKRVIKLINDLIYADK